MGWKEKEKEKKGAGVLIICRVLFCAVFPIGSVRFGAVNRAEPHRRIFALFKTEPHRTVGFTISENRTEPRRET